MSISYDPCGGEPARNAGAQFKVAAIGEGKCTLASYNRRDFYKISLQNVGDSRLCYGEHQGIVVDRPAIVFLNPLVPYSWLGTEGVQAEGYFCVFTPGFLGADAHLTGLADLLFVTASSPIYFLDPAQELYLTQLFRRMRQEVDSDYPYKDEFFRSHLSLIFHEALQLQRSRADQPAKATSRIARQFLTLLNRQFPADLPLQPLKLRRAGDFADEIAIHVNHLNAAVQESTGKSTTLHINERLVAEARSLLSHTDISIADIAYGLGFEYTTYFNRFFKKHTGLTPSTLRKAL